MTDTSMDSIAEANRIFAEAGWTTTQKPPWRGSHCIPGAVGGIAPDGTPYVKAYSAFPQGEAESYGFDPADYPDEPHEAAAWLVEHARRRMAPAADGPLGPVRPVAIETPVSEPEAEAVAELDALFGQEEIPGHEDEPARDADAGSPGVGSESPHDGGLGEAEGGMGDELRSLQQLSADSGWQAASDADGERDDGLDSPIDADFGDLPALDAPEPPDLGAELLDEGQFPDLPELEAPAPSEPPPAPDASPQGVVHAYGDSLHVMRNAKIGVVTQLRRAKNAVLQEGWTVSEFASLQNLIVRIDKGEAAPDEAARERFLWIGEQSRLMRRNDHYAEQCIEFLEGAGREEVEAFDPEAGWP